MSKINYWANVEKRDIQASEMFAKSCFTQIKSTHYKTLLDLGCNHGKSSLFFANKGFDVTSVDFYEPGISELHSIIKKRDIKNIKPIQTDIRKINFPDNSFDVIYAHLSLHYFNDLETIQIFDKLYNILNKGGMIFIKCKSVDDQLFGQGEKIEENVYKKEYTRHFFSEEYMSKVLENFKVIDVSKTFAKHSKSAFIEAVVTK